MLEIPLRVVPRMEAPNFHEEDAADHVNGAMFYLITEKGVIG